MPMDIFTIAIDRPHKSIYPVRLTTAIGEEDTATLELATEHSSHDVLEKLTYRDRTTHFSEAEVTTLGQWLANLLFQGATARLFQSALSRAQHAGHALQIQLVIANHHELAPVAALPWEFLADPGGAPFATRYSLVRSVPQSHPLPPLHVPGCLTMLLVWALPTEIANELPLDIETEIATVQTQLAPLIHANQLILHCVAHATPHAVQQAIHELQPHIVHVVAHGMAATAGPPQLVLETPTGGIQLVSPRQLREMLIDSPIRLVVLNACHSGTQGASLIHAFGPALLAAQVPAVVGMQSSVLDQAGRIFAQAFYRTLVSTGSIDLAMRRSRSALIVEDLSQIDWGLATLYVRAREGQLYTLAGATPSHGTRSPEAKSPSLPATPMQFTQFDDDQASARGFQSTPMLRVPALEWLNAEGQEVLMTALTAALHQGHRWLGFEFLLASLLKQPGRLLSLLAHEMGLDGARLRGKLRQLAGTGVRHGAHSAAEAWAGDTLLQLLPADSTVLRTAWQQAHPHEPCITPRMLLVLEGALALSIQRQRRIGHAELAQAALRQVRAPALQRFFYEAKLLGWDTTAIQVRAAEIAGSVDSMPAAPRPRHTAPEHLPIEYLSGPLDGLMTTVPAQAWWGSAHDSHLACPWDSELAARQGQFQLTGMDWLLVPEPSAPLIRSMSTGQRLSTPTRLALGDVLVASTTWIGIG